jgi:small subunit ribosomal protein S16
MAVHIRLARHGTKKLPFYRIVVTDHRSRRDGKFIENIGTFSPATAEAPFVINKDRFAYWQSKGAQASHTLTRLLKKQPPPAATPAA